MERLRQRADFLAAAGGAKAPTPVFVLQMRARPETGPARVGFTVSKRVGNAVQRNRVRRRLKDAVRQSSRLQAGHDYVLVGRTAALTAPFDRLKDELERALRRVHAPVQSGADGRTGKPRPHRDPAE